MAIVFQCGNCHARFEVDDRLAGRKARCKRCGHATAVPPPAPRLSPVAPAPAPAAAAALAGGRPPSWLEAVTSQVALKPLTVEQQPALRNAKPAAPAGPLDGESMTSNPYALASAPSLPALHRPGSGGGAAGAVVWAYRREVLTVQRIFRCLSESAYFISVPFLVLFILGVVLHNYPLVVISATVVVLLNAGRLVAGLGNLVAIPFRDSPLKGVLFLFPPYTVYYISKHWRRVQRPFQRVWEPLLTVGVVILAFALVPWLSGDTPDQAGALTRIEAGAGRLREGVAQTIEKGRQLTPEQIQAQAAQALQSAEGGFDSAPGSAGAAPESDAPQPEARPKSTRRRRP